MPFGGTIIAYDHGNVRIIRGGSLYINNLHHGAAEHGSFENGAGGRGPEPRRTHKRLHPMSRDMDVQEADHHSGLEIRCSYPVAGFPRSGPPSREPTT